MNNITKVFRSALAASAFTLFPALHAAILTSGHGDLGIGYEDGELEPHWHLGEDNEVVVIDGTPQNDPAGFEFTAAEITPQTNLAQVRQLGSQWNFIGVAAGASFYVFPQTSNPNVPFLGIGTEELVAADWSTDLTLTLTGATGPGQFSLYTESLSTPTELMSTFDGITAGDAVSVAAGTHTHYNWAFTQEGTYSLTFDVSGTHAVDGFKTATETFTFSVVPEPSSAGLLLGGAGLFFTFVRRRRA
ncbi:MAG: choice-of-anchor M domain-containing protein [Opitutales bacterium]